MNHFGHDFFLDSVLTHVNFKVVFSEQIRRKFGEASEKISKVIEKNLAVLDSYYAVFIDFVALENNIDSELFWSYFGETSDEFRGKFGDNRALLLFLIALNPSISAVEASEKIGMSDRTIETYFSQLKETVLERQGPDKGGIWRIKLK